MTIKANGGEHNEAASEQQTDGPLLDLTDASVKRMVKLAKKRGYITYEEINEVLPDGQSDPDQIEDVLSQLSEMGINVVEAEETEETTEAKASGESEDEDGAEGTEVAEIAPAKPVA